MIVLTFLLVTSCMAEVLRVPGEFATIQAALDSLTEGDTVLVSAGTYEETLIAPPLPFFLMGEAIADTGFSPQTVIDPTHLPGSDSLCCLILPAGSQAVIENLRFRNGPAMFPRQEFGGGVVNYSDEVTIRHCVFDSTHMGLWNASEEWGGTVTLQHCHFLKNPDGCVLVSRCHLKASNCLFSGRGFKLVACGDSSHFSGCHFRNNDRGYLLTTFGPAIEIENCIFGPYGPWAFPVVHSGGRGTRVHHNLFTDCQIGACVLRIHNLCEGDTTLVYNNEFRNNRLVMGQGITGISVSCDTTLHPMPFTAFIHDNVFQDCESTWGTKCVGLFAGAELRGNRFIRIEPPEYQTVSWWREVEPTLRDNIFLQTHYALARADQFVFTMADARFNYWGHATGPYHPTLNPDGLGDAVGDYVLFEPWYPDTSFLQSAEPRRALPERFSLTAYPNPFNSVVKLRFEAAEIGVYEIELFNLLGRNMGNLWKGPVGDVVEVNYRADALPSGVYFARVRNVIFNR
ncbi:T9SS type A sorting domain-containing protein, partial [bacterium]|nr:T9SS type A sorting domain-containing protein [bacterium]